MEVQWNLDSLSELKASILQVQQEAQQYDQFVYKNIQQPLNVGWKGTAGGEYQLILAVERIRLQQLTKLLSGLQEAVAQVEHNYRSCEENIQRELQWF